MDVSTAEEACSFSSGSWVITSVQSVTELGWDKVAALHIFSSLWVSDILVGRTVLFLLESPPSPDSLTLVIFGDFILPFRPSLLYNTSTQQKSHRNKSVIHLGSSRFYLSHQCYLVLKRSNGFSVPKQSTFVYGKLSPKLMPRLGICL